MLAFGAEMAKKLRQIPEPSVDTTTAPVAPIRQQPSAARTCTFYSRKGHRESNFYRCKGMASKAASTSDVTGSSSPSHRPNSSQGNHPPHLRSSHITSSTTPIKRCAVHDACNQTTVECFTILRHNTSRLDKLSVEDSCQLKKRLSPVNPTQQQHTSFSIPSLVAAYSSTHMPTIKFMFENVSISLGVDKGVSVTLLGQSAYSALKVKIPNLPLQLQKSNVILSSVQGLILHVAGTAILPISLAPNSDIFNIQFFVTYQFALPCDGLLDLDSLVDHDISVHPKRVAMVSGECFHPAMDVNFPFLPSIASTSDEQRISTIVSYAPLPCSSEEKRSSSER